MLRETKVVKDQYTETRYAKQRLYLLITTKQISRLIFSQSIDDSVD